MFLKFDSILYIVGLLSVGIVFTAGNDLKEEDRRAHSDRRGLWFGPRLGKRSYHDNNRDVYYRLMEATDALRYYYDQLPESLLDRRSDPETRVTKKVIFTPKLGRGLSDERQFADFTPRLGRATDDSTAPEEADRSEDRFGGRTRYFSPRLGRNMNFSPRLGRELVYENYPETVRVERSANNSTKKR